MHPSSIDPRLTTIRVPGEGVDLEVIVGGPDDGPLVILLHGFPDAWWTWRHQVDPLIDDGYRVALPSMRGYGGSGKPPGVRPYALEVLAADVLAMADGLGRPTFSLIGHDWGGVVAWETAIRVPERVERLVVLDAPHPDVQGRILRRNPSQLLRSAYVLFFQLPRLPEIVLGRRDHAAMRRALTASSAPGTFSDADLDRYAGEWARPGALTAMLNYYRALRRKPSREPARISPRTLVIWGEKDRFLSRASFDASLEMCDDADGRWIDDATHWVHLERPDTVADALLSHLRTGSEQRT